MREWRPRPSLSRATSHEPVVAPSWLEKIECAGVNTQVPKSSVSMRWAAHVPVPCGRLHFWRVLTSLS